MKSPKKLTPVAEGFSASVSSVNIDNKDYVLKVVEWQSNDHFLTPFSLLDSQQDSRLEQEFRRETKVYEAISASDSPLKEFVCSYYGSHKGNLQFIISSSNDFKKTIALECFWKKLIPTPSEF